MNRETALRRVKLLTLLIFGASLPAAGQSIYRLPAGTHLRVKVDVELSSKVASINDTFLATVYEPVKVNETVVLPTGSVVEGRVTDVRSAGAFGQSGSLKIVFEHLQAFGGTRSIDGSLTGEISPPKPCFLIAAFVKGREARLKKDEVFEIELKREVALPVTAY
jgi:hypothetical protein